jgi:hypothetical protein
VLINPKSSVYYFLIAGTQKPLLAQIAKDGHLSADSDKALNKIVVDFLATF